ncbi:hypothetical protein CDIMF43_50023 [Carnobacterium divergens]|nr:hypothetical protein CDIMF43_50023 [Carnobacterium divergens]
MLEPKLIKQLLFRIIGFILLLLLPFDLKIGLLISIIYFLIMWLPVCLLNFKKKK